jgi:ABC-type oligopeptide transport system substrate-binding subunit
MNHSLKKFMDGGFDSMVLTKDYMDLIFDKERNPREIVNEYGIRLHKYIDLSDVFFVFDMKDKILGKNKYLRQAISSAFNYQGYLEKFFDFFDRMNAQWLLPPGVLGYDAVYIPVMHYIRNTVSYLYLENYTPSPKKQKEVKYYRINTARKSRTLDRIKLGADISIIKRLWYNFMDAVDDLIIYVRNKSYFVKFRIWLGDLLYKPSGEPERIYEQR